ncbi:MAG TPA: hypothetical protein VF701_21350, partial [Thermoanaerobaculia bacterium]
MNDRKLLTALLFGALVAMPLAAQPGGPGFTITASERKETIDGALAKLREAYVFPDVAVKMEKAVRDRLAKGEYDKLTDGQEFAKKLTDDLRAVSKDKHLSIYAMPEGVPEHAVNPTPTAEQRATMRANAARVNFGFEKVERLQGNVGY